MYQDEESYASPLGLFEHVFGDSEGWMVTFTGRQARLDDPSGAARQNELTGIEQRYFSYPHAIRQAGDYLLDEAQTGRDTYYGVHLFRKSGNRRSSNAVGALSCLWMDEDEGSYPEIGPEPTAIIYSSRRRRHLYWQLTHSLSAEWVVSMNRRIAMWAGGDSGKAGLATVLRVAGTVNMKRYPTVDLVGGGITGVPAWDPEVLDQAIPPLPASDYKTAPSQPYDGPEIEISEYLSKVEVLYETPDSLSETKYAIVCPWIYEHTGGDRSGTYVGQRRGGGPWFHCNHEHCQHRRWTDFREATHQPTRRKRTKVFSIHTEVIRNAG